ncbi:cytochrome c oxidase assembly protein [Halobacillus mangrovi]|uniref:cytochrome c oxidase assembly protein n=1 Tax=Halobacillus mangrovi TaxID=402384 RepID=UPI003D97506C
MEGLTHVWMSYLLAALFVVALICYLVLTWMSKRRSRDWPLYRTVFWSLGIVCCLFSVVGPMAGLAQHDFYYHMVTHLLLGMLGPLLLVLGAPMTLALRALSVKKARLITRMLRSEPVSFLSHPITASILNIGGLWVLYTTDLYALMHQHLWLHVLVQVHVFLAGYLFTISLIYIDPTPHRYSFFYRTLVFIAALAAHGILSKYIYAFPPNGVSRAAAEAGGKLMYYGGDLIDMVIIFVLCLHWYRATRPRSMA